MIINKRHYISPALRLNIIELEQGIAAGSAIVRPTNTNDEVMEEWTIGETIYSESNIARN